MEYPSDLDMFRRQRVVSVSDGHNEIALPRDFDVGSRNPLTDVEATRKLGDMLADAAGIQPIVAPSRGPARPRRVEAGGGSLDIGEASSLIGTARHEYERQRDGKTPNRSQFAADPHDRRRGGRGRARERRAAARSLDAAAGWITVDELETAAGEVEDVMDATSRAQLDALNRAAHDRGGVLAPELTRRGDALMSSGVSTAEKSRILAEGRREYTSEITKAMKCGVATRDECDTIGADPSRSGRPLQLGLCGWDNTYGVCAPKSMDLQDDATRKTFLTEFDDIDVHFDWYLTQLRLNPFEKYREIQTLDQVMRCILDKAGDSASPTKADFRARRRAIIRTVKQMKPRLVEICSRRGQDTCNVVGKSMCEFHSDGACKFDGISNTPNMMKRVFTSQKWMRDVYRGATSDERSYAGLLHIVYHTRWHFAYLFAGILSATSAVPAPTAIAGFIPTVTRFLTAGNMAAAEAAVNKLVETDDGLYNDTDRANVTLYVAVSIVQRIIRLGGNALEMVAGWMKIQGILSWLGSTSLVGFTGTAGWMGSVGTVLTGAGPLVTATYFVGGVVAILLIYAALNGFSIQSLQDARQLAGKLGSLTNVGTQLMTAAMAAEVFASGSGLAAAGGGGDAITGAVTSVREMVGKFSAFKLSVTLGAISNFAGSRAVSDTAVPSRQLQQLETVYTDGVESWLRIASCKSCDINLAEFAGVEATKVFNGGMCDAIVTAMEEETTRLAAEEVKRSAEKVQLESTPVTRKTEKRRRGKRNVADLVSIFRAFVSDEGSGSD